MNTIVTERVDSEGSMLEEIRRNAESRLREIQPLIEEAERLRDVIAVISQRSTLGDRAADRVSGEADNARRAAKGANKRMILDLVARRPGVTPAEISRVTGVKRTVVASTVSRLKRSGELESHDGGGVQLAAIATAS